MIELLVEEDNLRLFIRRWILYGRYFYFNMDNCGNCYFVLKVGKSMSDVMFCGSEISNDSWEFMGII